MTAAGGEPGLSDTDGRTLYDVPSQTLPVLI